MALPTNTKKQTHHKKLHGGHHRRSKHYLRTYHPYLPLLILALIGFSMNTFWSARAGVLGATTNLSAPALLDSTNAIRSESQVTDLQLSHALNAAAQAKANDLVNRNYWAHTSPDGRSPWHFVKDAGYRYESAGENLAYGFSNAPSVINGWMNSREHRNNLLNAGYTDVGFGIARADNFMNKGPTTVIVAFYALPASEAQGSSLLSSSTGSTTVAPMRAVSRIQMLTGGQAPWSFMIISALTVAALALFVYRHARIWHRVLVKSEAFVVHHKFLDIVIITYSIAGYILTRAAGYIQ